METDLEASIKALAETLAEARVLAVMSATTAFLTEIIATMRKKGLITEAEAIAIPMRVSLIAAGKSQREEMMRDMALTIQHALTEDRGKKPS